MEETLRILVVDDDEAGRMAVRHALTKAGVQMELMEVGNGQEALSTLQKHSYDCIFLDYPLPDQDGLTLIHQLRSSEIKIPVVILTNQGDEQIAVELMKAGATDYLSKSRITPDILAQVLRNALRIHRAEVKVALANQQLRESHEELMRKNQELEQQRQQIQLQNLKLLEVSQLKSQFMAMISHELRTPMNAIIGFSQILLRPKFGELNHQQLDMIERILNNGKHLLMLLNEVLDFSKLESGRLELNPEIFDLTQVINTAVTEIRSLTEAKNLSLLVQTNLTNNLVFNDSMRVYQILLNLLSNAVKFTESGGISIEVTEMPADRLLIAVRDTGIGIAPRDFQHIFEAFQQVDQSITRKYPGTGLGLAIIDVLVKMMGGKIFLESQLGVGSIFKIDLPRQIQFPLQPVDDLNTQLETPEIVYKSQNTFSFLPPSGKTTMGYPRLNNLI